MNVKLSALIFVSFFVGTGCQTCHQSVGPNWKMVLTSEQEEYLNKYCHWRGLGIFILRLSGYSFSSDPTIDEIRSAGAHKFLKMPKTASWDDVMKNEKVVKYLTEENREKYSRIFLGRKDAGWLEILGKVETLRKLRRLGEVVMDTKRLQVVAFYFAKIDYISHNTFMNRTSVEQIKERLPINEVIGQYVKLEKSGASYKAKCPFHNEKSASFFVSPDRGGYYCFGCGAKGDIFTFVEQFEGLDFRGALKILAERAGVQLTFDKKADGERDQLFQIIEDATKFFEGQLGAQSASAKEVREYLKKRGITDVTRAEFRIGWAPDGWNHLHDYLKKKGWNDLIIEKAGLIKRKDSASVIPAKAGIQDQTINSGLNGNTLDSRRSLPLASNRGGSDNIKGSTSSFYDRFRGRVIFPISDSSGRVIAFSGRILKDDGKSAKYLNSPDTPLFDKSLVLYGLDKAKSDIRRMNYTIMVEGQMDLVMSHQSGIKNTVASSGTALTDESFSETGAISNLGLVRRLSPNVIIAFDSDTAGRKAAMRASGIALSMGMDVKIADLVGGKDPADLVLHNPEDWKQALRAAKPIIEFELGNVMRDVPDPRKLPRALRERVFPFLARIESRMDQAHFVKMIADKTNITETAVWDDLRKVKVETATSRSVIPAKAGIQGQINNTELSANAMDSGLRRNDTTHHLDLIERRMFGLLTLIEKSSLPSAKEYREQIKKIADDTYAKRIAVIEPLMSDLTFEAEAFFGGDQKNWDNHMKELVINFEEDVINQELIASMNELKTAEKAGDMNRVAELAKKCQVLSMRKAEVGKKKRG